MPREQEPLPTHGERVEARQAKNVPWGPKSFIDQLYADWEASDGPDTYPEGPTE